MNFAATTFRSIAIAAALTAAAASSQALTLGFQGTQSNSVQTFSKDATGGFKALQITVAPKGNATAVANDPASFSFPITSVTIGSKLNIAAGSAVGSALYISRFNDDDVLVAVTLANFTINYETKKVLADTKAGVAGATVLQQPLYDFTVNTALALKYKFPLTITGHEVLNNLRLTADAKASFIAGLELPVFAVPLLDNDFGLLTQDINTTARKPAASTAAFKP